MALRLYSFGLCSAQRDELPLRLGEPLILAGISIDPIKQSKIDKTDKTGRRETPTPPEVQQQQTEKRYSDPGGELGGRVRDRRCQATFASRKPIAERLGIRREGGRLAHAQQQSCGDKCSHPCGKRSAEGSNAPQKRAAAADPAHSEAIEQNSDRHLH